MAMFAASFNTLGFEIAEKAGLSLLLDPYNSGVILRAACNVTSIIYPAYASFKAIEQTRESEQQSQWLSYWSIIGLISLMEGKMDDTLKDVPYYYHVKLGALVWLQMQGARYLYTHYIRPGMTRFGPKIDIVLNSLANYAAMIYAIYKVPIDSAIVLAKAAFTKSQEFGKWFLSKPEGDSRSTQFIRG